MKKEKNNIIVVDYSIEYTGGNIYCLFGHLDDGTWILSGTPNDSDSILVYKTEEERDEAYYEDAIEEIESCDPRYYEIWCQVLNDAKNSDNPDISEQVPYWEEELKNQVSGTFEG